MSKPNPEKKHSGKPTASKDDEKPWHMRSDTLALLRGKKEAEDKILRERAARKKATEQNSEPLIIKDGLGMGSSALQKELEKYKTD